MGRSTVENHNIQLIENSEFVNIKDIIEKYFTKLEINIKNETLSIYDELSYLLAITDCYELLEDKEKWGNIVFSLMKKQKNYIENYGSQISIGLLSGLSDISTIISVLNKKTGSYEAFLKSLNNFIYEKVILNNKNLENKLNNIDPAHFDLVNGMSGTCHYLLSCEQDIKRDEAITSILKFLVNMIIGKKFINNVGVPYWHIGKEHLRQPYEITEYPNGYLNFSLSHGVCSVLFVLSESLSKGIVVENQKKAIDYLLSLYKKYGELNEEDGIVYWPGMISLEDFLNNNYKSYKSPRQSWCYGSIGISGSLLAISLFLENKKLYFEMCDNLVKISNKNIYEYRLNSPIICHGYSGILEILLTSSKKHVKNINKNTINQLVKLLIDGYDDNSLFGYKDYTISDNQKNIYTFKDRNSLLEGSAGIVLTLASIIKKDTILDRYLFI
ncbi:MAG: lanthionine synthetase C family protein [Gallicola sp.]|nr:lanthionine synthetase C family protein [Gallicola sp.]